MILYLDAKTPYPDLLVDFITVQLHDGRQVSVNWDSSDICRGDDGFSAKYSGVYFDEEYANGQLDALNGMKILAVQTCIHGEEHDSDGKDLSIVSMLFCDGDRELSINSESDEGRYALKTLAEETLYQHDFRLYDINTGMLKYQVFAHGHVDGISFGLLYDVDAKLVCEGNKVEIIVKRCGTAKGKMSCTKEMDIPDFYSMQPRALCNFLEGMIQEIPLKHKTLFGVLLGISGTLKRKGDH